MIQFKRKTLSLAVAVTCAAITAGAVASSHREAPNITRHPALDSTDFYAFNSYEQGREGYVTFIANYIPLQDAYGGPNYFAMDTAYVWGGPLRMMELKTRKIIEQAQVE